MISNCALSGLAEKKRKILNEYFGLNESRGDKDKEDSKCER